jgi:heat shock protein HtpX
MALFKRFGLFILTNFLILITVSIILNIIYSLGIFDGVDAYYTQIIVLSVVWGFVGSFISLAISKFMAKRAMGVKTIDPNKATGVERELVSRVQRLASSAGIPMPEVGIYQSPEINAFATGRSKSSSLVAVSTGLLNYMDDREVEGVLAHEVSHIANGDMVTMTLIQGVINSFVLFFSIIVANLISNVLRQNSDSSESRNSSPFLDFMIRQVLMIVFGFLGSIVTSWFSRTREFRADAGAAKLAGRESMIAALEKLQLYVNAPQDKRGEAIASLKISDKSKIMALFSTHPPLSVRIEALRRGRM